VWLTNGDRWFFIQLYRWFPSILQVVKIVRPETLMHWHRADFRRHGAGVHARANNPSGPQRMVCPRRVTGGATESTTPSAAKSVRGSRSWRPLSSPRAHVAHRRFNILWFWASASHACRRFRRQPLRHRLRSWRRSMVSVPDMIEISRDAPGSVACGRSGLPLLAICPNRHRRTVPFRLVRTSESDQTPLYGRPFKCRACGSSEVTLYGIESQAELDALHSAMAEPRKPAKAPTTHPPRDPAAGFV
jgi:ribosomal protein L34E